MKKIEVLLNREGKKIGVNSFFVPWWFEGIGLMFSRRESARNLLFRFFSGTRTPIHSFFVFYDFYAIWMDDKFRILEIKRVSPFSFYVCPKEDFVYLLEIPINRRNKEIIDFIDENLL